jgi:DNA polymerase-3 subunit beta
MKFTVEREHLLKPLQQVSGPLVVARRCHSRYLLLQVADGTLSLTGTDLEMEMVARVALTQPHEAGATVPARKFFDICRGLPEGGDRRSAGRRPYAGAFWPQPLLALDAARCRFPESG